MPVFKKSSDFKRKRLESARSMTKLLHSITERSRINTDDLTYIYSEEDNQADIIPEEVNEAYANDYGYYSHFHTGCNEDNIDNTENYYNPSNLIEQLSYKASNKRDLLLHFSKSENYSEMTLVDIPELMDKRRRRNYTLPKSQLPIEAKDDLIRNTINSFMNEQQTNLILKRRMEEALLLNKQYKQVKECYELSLIRALAQKYEDYKDCQKKGFDGELDFEDDYIHLKEDSNTLFEEYEEMNSKYYGKRLKVKVTDINNKAKHVLYKFMENVIFKMKREEGRAERAFLKWKKKMSESVNIWDLFDSNGMDVKLSFKYLILYKFFNNRSKYKQEGRKFLEAIENRVDIANSAPRDKENLPVLIFFESDLLGIIIDIFSAILLLYSFITVPIRLFLNADSVVLTLIEKFVDMFFYIIIMADFRTGYKDKYNNDVVDVHRITKRYLASFFVVDFISSIPWSFFFLDFANVTYSLKLITHVVKILRIIRLLPILNKLERIKGFAIYFRLLKLLIIYFLITHWMACLLYYSINLSFDYSNQESSCYYTNIDNSKTNINVKCSYVYSFYQASFLIPGQYTSYMHAYDNLIPFHEYMTLIAEYVLGQCISAYIFGGLTDILQNLNQGMNFFRQKTDLLREHMLFYSINHYTQTDARVYYDYLWQRHKDVIYGKNHFSLLSKSLREKFENMNLTNNEIYLSRFYQLGNPKLVGDILMNLKKVILLPYEILFEEGGVTPGIYILLNGEIILENQIIPNQASETITVSPSDLIKKNTLLDEQKEIKIFPLLSAFIKTGRSYRRCYSTEFSDVLFLSLESFDELIAGFPIEIHSLKIDVMKETEQFKLFENEHIMNMLCVHSNRSIGSYYENKYKALNIWIPVPIPISQRKIARNYMESFVTKVRKQWREILLSADLNIALYSVKIITMLRSNNAIKKKYAERVVQNRDPLDSLKLLVKSVDDLTDELIKII
jgi:hypothetical protein